ncbi:CBS domain-containing protein [Methylobacterium organophilum]|uniref:CBS domain-containing protein n=1 Tax=Methylobacterium organophilum TaxID=410 RepID=A0ABQ4T8G5_METOR|nr:CBS domain-containing protein [Methylobacterium organophilum]GJE26377.1 hypothetical protein LKMONMHP_1228 [Methylobacterium organophilum]
METMRGATGEMRAVPRIQADRSVEEAAQLLTRSGSSAVVVVEGSGDDAAILGLLTERDIFRAVAAEGPDIYNGCVWRITRHDYASLDIRSSDEDRVRMFCERQVDHIALVDGLRLDSVLSLWDCARDVCAASHGAGR